MNAWRPRRHNEAAELVNLADTEGRPEAFEGLPGQLYHQAGMYQIVGDWLGHDPDLYRLLADALEGKFEPQRTTPTS